MRIDYPSEAEREASIQAILDRGLDPKPTLRRRLFGLYRVLGLRGLLFGVGDCVLLAVLLAGSAAIPLLSILWAQPDPRALLYPITGSAPLLYAALLLFTFWKEEQLGTRELKMTVFYDLRQLTALRLLLFSGMGVTGNLLLCAAAAALCKNMVFFIQLLTLSLGALFLYVALTLAWLLFVPVRLQPVLPVAWCVLCVLPALLIKEEALVVFLDELPLVGSALSAFFAAFTALLLLRAYLLHFRKEDSYAYG